MNEEGMGPPPFDELDETILRKMDGGLRRLLLRSDEELLELVDAEESRLVEQVREIEEWAAKTPPPESEEERQVVDRIQRRLRDSLLIKTKIGVLVIDPSRLRPARIRAVTRFHGNRKDLEAMGLEVGGQAHDIFTVVGTRQQLATLAAQAATRSVRLPRLLKPTVEDASAQGEVSAVHQPRPLNPTGFQGDGVIVGIIDSPLDVTHHGFQEPVANAQGDHETRVLYYWVQDPDVANPPGQTPQQFDAVRFNGLNYGRIYTAAQINTALGLAGSPYGNGPNQISCQPSNAEHGTHVAGIAAGNGRENNWQTAPTHIGAAPEAAIVHVCYRWSTANAHSTVFEDDVINALSFIFGAAVRENMPVVANASLGTNLGPHDGATAFDVARDNLLNSFDNRSIVWAAGNDNSDNGYRTETIAAGGTEATLTFTPWWFFDPSDRFLDIWYSGPELDYHLQCGTDPSGWRTAGQGYTGNLNGYDVEADRDPETSAGMRGIRIYFEDARSTDPWTIRLRNPHASDSVTYHAWTGVQGRSASLNNSSQNENTLGDTACGKSILTVGACAKRNPPSPAAGEAVTDYSGAGPTLDGRIKPELAAVGGTPADQITSANSNQASGYTGKYGTSMASPLVAGAVALLLDEYNTTLNRNINQDTIKALLTQNTNRVGLNLDPVQVGYVATERNRYGHGRLRLIAPIDHAMPPM